MSKLTPEQMLNLEAAIKILNTAKEVNSIPLVEAAHDMLKTMLHAAQGPAPTPKTAKQASAEPRKVSQPKPAKVSEEKFLPPPVAKSVVSREPQENPNSFYQEMHCPFTMIKTKCPGYENGECKGLHTNPRGNPQHWIQFFNPFGKMSARGYFPHLISNGHAMKIVATSNGKQPMNIDEKLGATNCVGMVHINEDGSPDWSSLNNSLPDILKLLNANLQTVFNTVKKTAQKNQWVVPYPKKNSTILTRDLPWGDRSESNELPSIDQEESDESCENSDEGDEGDSEDSDNLPSSEEADR